MKLINNTGQPKVVHYVDGSTEIIKPGESLEVNESKIYAFEMEKLKKKLTVQRSKIKKVKPAPAPVPVKEEVKKPVLSKNDGGGS